MLGADKNLAPVRSTALVYLGQRQNVVTTADLLFAHQNTVRLRAHRPRNRL